MLLLILKRTSLLPFSSGVLQRVTSAGAIPVCVTLEPPWVDNEENKSCIPPGVYTCRRKVSPRFGITFEVVNVPNRSDILFHRGNSVADTNGCIIIADGFSYPTPGVSFSKPAFSKFLEVTESFSEFQLEIMNP